jgi:hypothetical protein
MKLNLKRLLYLVSTALPNLWVFNYLIAAAYFFRGNGRLPRTPNSSNAAINDYIFYKMIRNNWSILEQFCVDKQFSKIYASHASSVKVARTISVFSIDKNESVEDFIKWLKPFMGKRLIAKPTHGSGKVLFLDRSIAEDAIRDFFTYSKTNFFYIVRETQYKNLERKIIVEQNISKANTINDYKFFCAKGSVMFCQVDVDRFINHKRAICTVPEFEQIHLKTKFLNNPDSLQRPLRFDEMIKIAAELSADFDFVRIDLYDVDDGIYFGEYTFSPDAASANYSNEVFAIESLRKIRALLCNHSPASPRFHAT